jgi:hypothetical protein
MNRVLPFFKKNSFLFSLLLVLLIGANIHARSGPGQIPATVTADEVNNTITIKGTSNTSVSGNIVTGIEFFVRWPKSHGANLLSNLQSHIPGVTYVDGYGGAIDDVEEPSTHYIQWFAYSNFSGANFDVVSGVEFEIATFDVNYTGTDTLTIELASDNSFLTLSYFVWFYSNPPLDLTPPFGSQFYGDAVRISGDYEYEGATFAPTAAPSCDRPNSVVGTHISGSDLSICWNPGNPGSHVDKVQVQIRRKPNQPGCAPNNANRLADPGDSPANCVLVPFNTSNCDCVYQSRVRYRCTDGNFSPWKFDNTIATSCADVRLANDPNFRPYEVYPNPTADKLFLDFVPWQDGYLQISIFDMLGNLMNSTRHFVHEGDNTISFDVGQYSAGMYVMQIMEGSEKHVKKFSVER